MTGKELKEWRNERGVSQAKLTSIMNKVLPRKNNGELPMNIWTIRNWEQGKRRFNSGIQPSIVAVLEALNIPKQEKEQ